MRKIAPSASAAPLGVGAIGGSVGASGALSAGGDDGLILAASIAASTSRSSRLKSFVKLTKSAEVDAAAHAPVGAG